MNESIPTLRLFVRVARSGSFSGAGRDVGLSQPSASRLIAALERDVGAALFTRTARAVRLTEAGARYLARVEPIIAALDEADHEARGTGELRGALRIGVSSSLAIREVVPALPAFMSRHPALNIEILIDDHRQDLILEGVDVALRFGALGDSTATARKIATWPRMIAASPAYLEQRGVPEHPSDLARHSVIIGPSGVASGWTFRKDRRVVQVTVEGRLTISVNEGAVAAAVAGLGVIATVRPGCRGELGRGALLQVLPAWDMGCVDLHAVFPGGHGAKPSARAFGDFLIDTLRDV
jgi:DNA-binding transcriptional LysR family regulator